MNIFDDSSDVEVKEKKPKVKPAAGHCDYKSMKPYIDITESAKKDAIKKMEEAFKKKYSGIKADIRRIIIGEYLDFSPNIQ